MWSTVISETAVTLYQLIVVRHLLSYKKLFHGSWKYFISGLIMFVVVFWMNRNLKNTWLMMAIEILAGVMIYISIVLILRAPIVYEARDLVIQKLRK